MSYQLWSQDNFSKGELSPYMYARAQVNQYYDGLKEAQNVLTYPTGAAGKRFGTLFQAILTNITASNQIFFKVFQYLDECIYQVIFSPNQINIYLEGILVASAIATIFDALSVYNLSCTILGSTLRVSGQGFAPYDLTRSPDSPNLINGFDGVNNLLILTTSITSGLILPAKFTNTSGELPRTLPQIKEGITYFVKNISTNSVALYSTAYDAKFNLNRYSIISSGTGTNNIITQNTWSFSNTNFKNLPVYDFNGNTTSYDNLVFTPLASSGSAVTVNISGSGYSKLDSTYIGGTFIAGGGTSRITAVASNTSFTVSVQTPFDSAYSSGYTGSLVFLAEPAWSNSRGWPQICSSYQNRALFANTESLPNGFWASVVNDYPNFGDLTNDDDDAISWFPSSDQVNVIRFIVPFRSLTLHTNSGIYSSPLSEISAITPSTFTLQLQDSTPADVLQPQSIDNQILVLSGNDLHTMLWDGINNAYTSNIVSIVSEQVIRDPVDEASFADLRRAGSRYVFVINSNGSMAVYQTLIAENVSGFTPQIMEQSYGNAKFLQAESSSNGRCWFICQRDQASLQASIPISSFTSNTLTAVGSNFNTTIPTAITFVTSGSLPLSSPQIQINTYYWVIGLTADTFQVYADQNDALSGINIFTFTSSGINSNVVPWPLLPIFTLEELTQDVRLDCAVYYNGTPTDTINTGVLFNAQSVKMIGDGYGFDDIGVSDSVVFRSHGTTVNVSEAYIGFPINLLIQPMPLTMPPGQQTTLTKPKHVRSVRFMFNNTIGGTINGIPIALQSFNQINIGDPPFPARGIFEISIMKGWDDFNVPTFTIEHNNPFNIELIGIFYSVDT